MVTVEHILIGAGLFCVWALFVFVSPVRKKCSWCKGTKRAKRHRYYGRVGVCRKCRGLGKHERLGASLVHRWFWMLVSDWVRDRIRKRYIGRDS